MAEDVRAAYRADGEKFVRVVGRLADCKWKVEEHAWLSQRNRSRLMRAEAGRRQLATDFDDPTRPAVLLMDGRVRNRAGKDGAEQRNAVELRRLSRRTGKPIAAWGALRLAGALFALRGKAVPAIKGKAAPGLKARMLLAVPR